MIVHKSIAITCQLWYVNRMEFTELLEIVGEEPLFETGLLLSGDVQPKDIQRQISRWKRAGKIYQIRRGLYSLAPPFQKEYPHPFLVANQIVSASYVSLQSALAHYGMIPEYVPVTTSVTTARPARWETPLGIFDFRHIQTDFFYGYHLVDLIEEQQAFIARPEKALLDLVYLQPGGDTPEYLTELRLGNLNRLDWDILDQFLNQFEKPKLVRAAAVIKDLADQEEEFEEI